MSDLNAPPPSCSPSSSTVSQPPEPGFAFHQAGWHDPLQVPESDTLRKGITVHHHGDIYNTTNIHNAPVTTIRHADNVNVRLVADEDIALLESLPMQQDISGQWSDYLKDSRGKDIEEICAWAGSQTATGLLLWVHAPAGFGKSTLARQLKHHLHSQNRLAAAVFFGQLPTDSLGPETVIKLIGGELGRTHHGAVPAIARAVRQSHGASLQVQLESYVRDPLLLLNLPHPLVVILDAIDEWRSHYHLISELGHLTSHTSLIRFVVLSRSEPRERLCKNVSIQPHPLLPVSVEVMQEYLDARFENIEWGFGRRPTTKEVVRLATMADGLFVWLSIICSLLEESRSNPQDTLTAILHSRHTVGDTNHQLAMLYYKALDQLFPRPGDKDELRVFLGYSTILQESLPLDAFSQISGISTYTIKRISLPLKTLQIRQPADSVATVYPAANLFHGSFIEYVRSTSTPPDIAFPIPSSPFHHQLGEACLRVLARCLQTSMDLDKLSRYLSPACKYAVMFWMWHISKGALPVKPGVHADGKEITGSSILEGGGVLALLRQWAALFVNLLELDTSDLPGGDDVNSLMRAAAESVDAARASTVVFKIPCLEVAVHVAPDSAESWKELGAAYSDQSDVDDSLEFVQRAVKSCQRAVDIVQGCQSKERSSYLGALARSLFIRSQRASGNIEDLSKFFSLERQIMLLCPAGHSDPSTSLNHLTNNLHSRSQEHDTVGDLGEAISLDREALALCPSDHPNRLTSLHSLAVILHARFKVSGAVGDLEEAIALHRQALALRLASGHLDFMDSFASLAICLHSRFEESGTAGDLEEAILLHREALALRPSGHPNRPDSLNNLGSSLHYRFKECGAVGDLEEAISLEREALALRQSGHPDRPYSLSNLAICLHSRFEEFSVVGDLEETVSLWREALALCPSGHPGHSYFLASLATCLHSCFQESGAVGELEEAILLHREALNHRPSGHPDRPTSLSNLANSLRSSFEESGTVGSLEEAIVLHREALALRASSHPERPRSLNNLAISLQSRFKEFGAVEDLEEAIALDREALALHTSGHPDRPISLNNLAAGLRSRFKESGTAGDLEEAIILMREAISLRSPGDSRRPVMLRTLRLALHDRFSSNGTMDDFHEAVALAEEELAFYALDDPNRDDILDWLASRRGPVTSSI